MYPILLILHSAFRWLVLISLLFSLARAYRGWMMKKAFTRFDNQVRHWTATMAHIQLLLGLGLYFISPIISYFFDNFKEALHERELRFFGMEHSLMMFIAVVVITIGSVKSKRRHTDAEKYKTMATWFTLGLVLILTSIPWAFSPLVSRPYLRFP